MDSSMKTNALCWLTLILLTITGVMISEGESGLNSTLIILSAALIKSGLVGWRFMELHTAHVIWKTAFLFMMSGLFGLLYVLA